jgi:hypothetical protein
MQYCSVLLVGDAAVEAKPMPSEAADYGEPYYFDLNWMSVKLTQLLLAEVSMPHFLP